MHHLLVQFNFLLNDEILDWSKLKVFAEDKININEKLKFCSGRVENIVGKGENAGYQHFLLFPQCFRMSSSPGSLNLGIVWERVNSLPNNKILDWSKFKAHAADKMTVSQNLPFVLGRVENLVRKGSPYLCKKKFF